MEVAATLFKPLSTGAILCTACAQACKLAEGETGLCGIRQVKNGQLMLLVYALAAATHIDPVEKKPLYHFLPGSQSFSVGTVGCNFSCAFCQNADISQAPKGAQGRIFGRELLPQTAVDLAVQNGCRSISYTYNEPAVFYEYARDTALLAQKAGLKNIFVTGGFETRALLDDAAGWLDAMNIDLKSFSDPFYRKICGARLKPVLETIGYAHAKGIWIELTTLVIEGLNDSDEELTQIARFIAELSPDIPWHVSGFRPCYQLTDRPATSPQTLHRAYEIGKAAGLNFVYTGNLFDPEHTATPCPACGFRVIERSGYLGERVRSFLKQNKCPNCGREIAGLF
ncbi:MAG: AmmeMemoRadiSam system radical SAM enzyme [Campylobacterales bacterium]